MTTTPVLNTKIDRAARERIVRAAQIRGMQVGEYLAHLVDLHDVVRARADAGDAALTAELEARGLQTVRG